MLHRHVISISILIVIALLLCARFTFFFLQHAFIACVNIYFDLNKCIRISGPYEYLLFVPSIHIYLVLTFYNSLFLFILFGLCMNV